MNAKTKFLAHLDRSSEIVKDWPNWKQRVVEENRHAKVKVAKKPIAAGTQQKVKSQ